MRETGVVLWWDPELCRGVITSDLGEALNVSGIHVRRSPVLYKGMQVGFERKNDMYGVPIATKVSVDPQ